MGDAIDTANAKHQMLHTSIKITLAAAAAYALWRWVDWSRVVASLLTMSIGGVLLSVVLVSLDRVLMGFKWRELVGAGGGTLRLRDAISIYYQTSFADHVLPNLVTSEALRVYLGRTRAIPAPLLLGSMAIERLIGALAAIALAGVGLLVVAAQLEPQMRATFIDIVAFATLIGALAVLVMWWTPLHRLVKRADVHALRSMARGLTARCVSALSEWRQLSRCCARIDALVDHVYGFLACTTNRPLSWVIF